MTLAVHVIPTRMQANLIVRQATHATDLARVHCVLLSIRLLLLLLQGHLSEKCIRKEGDAEDGDEDLLQEKKKRERRGKSV